MSDAISAMTPSAIGLSVSSVKTQNGNQRQSAVAKAGTRRRVRSTLSLTDLTNLIAPAYKVNIKSYGFNMYGKAAGGASAGDLRQIYNAAGSQYWFEAYGLPAIDINANPTTCNMQQLMYKAVDIRNVDNATLPVPLVINPLQGGSDQTRLESQFQYIDGSQKHTFVNSGNTTVYGEFWELIPRHPMIAYNTDGTAKTIGDDVIADYATNQPVANVATPVYTTASYNAVSDNMVRINSKLNRINSKYKVSKPVKICIQPGGTFVYTMSFGSFKCTNTEWNVLVGNNANDDYNRAQWIPGFTKILVARFWGELSHTVAVDRVYSAVNCGPLSLMHTMSEYHHCRAMPFQPTKNVILDYRMDKSTAATYHVDELEQDNENFDN